MNTPELDREHPDEESPAPGDREEVTVDDELDLDDAEYGFEPVVSATGAESTEGDASDDASGRRPGPALPRGRRQNRRPNRRQGLRHRLGATAALFVALAAMGGAYAAFATASGATDAAAGAENIDAGRQLFQSSCITCHGVNLEGVHGQGPSLIGVGGAAAYFQVSTGRMPVASQGAYIGRKDPKFNEKQTEQIAAYIQSVGGGPTLPKGSLRVPASQIGLGGELYRLNCASCHGVTEKGAPLSGGKSVPSLNASTDRQIYAAMLSGPESMPVFSNNQLTTQQKHQIITYIQTMKASKDPGGSGIDRIGPVSEAIVIWVAGVGLLMVTILWIGARAR
jgi:ubiquinol-cytochrome c reductase cytochrome c subunit